MRMTVPFILIALLLAGCSPYESRFLRVPRTMWQAPDRAIVLDIPGANNATIRAWLFQPDTHHAATPSPLLIIAHGRSDAMSDYRQLAPRLADETGSAVCVFDYRGFGASSDLEHPTRQTLIEDTARVIERLRARDDTDPDRTILFGVSLGAYPASASFADDPTISALMLWGAPADIKRLIADGHESLNPITQLLAQLIIQRHREPLDSIRLANNRPVLIAHAENDAIVRVRHAELLAEAADHATIIIDPGGTHTSISEPTITRMIEFVRHHNGIPGDTGT